MDQPVPQFKQKPPLIITSSTALKEFDSAGLKGHLIDNYDVMLPDEFNAKRDELFMEIPPEEAMAMSRPLLEKYINSGDYPDLTTDDIRTAVLFASGKLGKDARLVGIPPELQEEANFLALKLGKEDMTYGRAYGKSHELLDELDLSETQREMAERGIRAERKMSSPVKAMRSAYKKARKSKRVQPGWKRLRDKVRTEDKRRGIRMDDIIPDEEVERAQRFRYADYYERLGDFAAPDSPFRDEVIDEFAQQRYQTLMDYEQEEVPRQMEWLDEHGYDPKTLTLKQVAESGSELRKFLIDHKISERKDKLDELNHEDTTPERKRELELEMMQRLHNQGAATPKTGGQELGMLKHGITGEVEERMRGINLGRHREVHTPTIDL